MGGGGGGGVVFFFSSRRRHTRLRRDWSSDVCSSDLEHCEFLAETTGKEDPRIAMIEQLIKETKRPGDIWVYNIGFERARLTEIAKNLPKYKKAALIIADRLKDLMIPFQQKLYYTPEMDGRYSIKKVLPALVRSEEHTSELQSRRNLVCRLLLEKKNKKTKKK